MAEITAEQLLQLNRTSRSSIEVSRNFKGEYGWVIKRYYDDEPDGVNAAMDGIRGIDAELRSEFLSAADAS